VNLSGRLPWLCDLRRRQFSRCGANGQPRRFSSTRGSENRARRQCSVARKPRPNARRAAPRLYRTRNRLRCLPGRLRQVHLLGWSRAFRLAGPARRQGIAEESRLPPRLRLTGAFPDVACQPLRAGCRALRECEMRCLRGRHVTADVAQRGKRLTAYCRAAAKPRRFNERQLPAHLFLLCAASETICNDCFTLPPFPRL